MNSPVQEYLDKVAPTTRRRDAETLLELMGRVTGESARMWGSSIVGFGQYHYHYVSGRQGDGPAASFSPRKAAMTIYLPDGTGAYADPLSRLGPHTTSVGCLYIKDLTQVDLGVLEEIVGESYRTLTAGTFTNRAADHR
jgi:hypothetical protein